jgi:hypothetical protein
MRIGAVIKVQIGCSLAAVSGITIGTAELLIHVASLGSRAGIICGAMGGAGVVTWLCGRAAQGSSDPADISLARLARPGYWGLLVALSALLAYSHSAYRRVQKPPPVAVAPAPVPVAVPAPPVIEFPALLLQGIVFQGARSSALINGRVLYAGDEISLVQVVAIAPDHVLVAMQGQTNVLRLGNGPGEKRS